MPLPPFLLTNEVTAESGKQDHIQVTFKSWVIRGTTDNIDNLRHRIGAPPESVRHGDVDDIMALWGRLFNRPQENGAYRRPLSVRGEPLNIGGVSVPPPLFSGSWKFNYYVHDDAAERPIRTRLDLHLNPTRYVRYQSPVPLPMAAAHAHWPEPRLYAHRGAPEINGEAVLNNNDNWLPQTQRWMVFTNPARWRWHLRKYLDGVTEEFLSEISRITHDVPGIELVNEAQKFSLTAAETYWEFSSENPTALVASLEPLLRSFSARCCESTAFNGTTASGAFHNALCLKASISQGRQIRIYAKTNRRVRVEVVHSFRGANGFAVEGGHTGDCEDLPDKLEQLAQDAAELVTRMFTHFRSQNDVTPAHISAYHLLMEIIRHARDFSAAQTIASALIRFGRVASNGVGEKMQNALHRLSGAGVLEYKAQSHGYVVTAPRRHPLRMLKERGDFSLLTARVRRRTPQM